MLKVQFLALTSVVLFSFSASATDPADARAAATAAVTMAPSITIITPTELTYELGTEDYKVLYVAKDDAAVFIATEGAMRTVRLQRALEVMRRVQPKLVASDLEIAEGIAAL